MGSMEDMAHREAVGYELYVSARSQLLGGGHEVHARAVGLII